MKRNPYAKNGQNHVGTRTGYAELHDHMWLLEKYWQERMSSNEIAKGLGCTPKAVLNALEREKIPIRDKSLAQEYRWGGRNE